MRTERDSMGEMQVPEDALYGASTQRAVFNFQISNWTMPPSFLMALGLVKEACAAVNQRSGALPEILAKPIITAASELRKGKWLEQFPVDVFQTGSATSTNMNANEMIAQRAGQLSNLQIHPNDHVNLGQSSNDVIPTVLHISIVLGLKEQLLPALVKMQSELTRLAKKFEPIFKLGRTHLQDATPIRLGQVFSGYAAQIEDAYHRLALAKESLYSLAIGGTAVGTGLNTTAEFGKAVSAEIAAITGLPFYETKNHFSAQAAMDHVLHFFGVLKTTAVTLTKIANDIRFLASGPRAGYGELKLQPLQPGSSIMPGKVNPVMCEMLMQVCAFVIGAESMASSSTMILSNFELCVSLPLLAWSGLESIRILSSGITAFSNDALSGLEADGDRCTEQIDRSLAMCTALVPIVGYDKAAEIAKTAYQTNRTVIEAAREQVSVSAEELKRIFDPAAMTMPSLTVKPGGG